ncbi:restriction endonuclease subunit S [Methylophaga sp. SB9B]|uniref:restriction endonuclease subunit S n=1 Tax=Methylophaga sp. SB9B TaxID=2570356 RepID=UPI0010A88E7C|nr:restriction endonuclease subunit S [Methylophaga sp. SB9B]THK40572.1 restriction endonuclease subunit S [Methylophaga sp. SB9B]
MVDSNLAYKFQKVEQEIDYTYLPDQLKYTSVSLADIFKNSLRLEANAFNLKAKVAKEKILANKYGTVKLWSEHGLIERAFHRPRFKRIYVVPKEIPFFQPSSITEVYPKPTKFISAKTETNLESLRVKKGMLLMTVSGTIGKVAIAGNKLNNQVFSHDLLRVTGKGKYDTGYIYCYFLTEAGQHILQSNNYGAVIKHIEPEHLKNIIIPNAPDILKKEIHETIIESYDLRDKSNGLIDQAEKILYEELQLKPIEELETEYFENTVGLRSYTSKLSDLGFRLDGSYHLPIFKSIQSHIEKFGSEIKYLKNKDISKSIILPGRFKRTYVDSEEYGIKFIGGKQILDLNPSSEKFLSKLIHDTRLGKELLLLENCILITRSGTIGKVSLVPKHWENWAANEHIIRVFPKNKEIAGYLFCWLNSDYGKEMIKKHTYGAVVDEIDTNHVGDIPLPILKNQQKQKEINDLVLNANELRYEAHLKEQEAIRKMEEIINNTY